MELSAIISKFCKEKHVCIKMLKYLSIYIRILKHYNHHLGIFIFVPLINLWYLYLLFCIKGPHSIIISSLLQLIILYHCGELEGDLEREKQQGCLFQNSSPFPLPAVTYLPAGTNDSYRSHNRGLWFHSLRSKDI